MGDSLGTLVHDRHPDVRTLQGDDAARGPTHVARADAADLGDLGHVGAVGDGRHRVRRAPVMMATVVVMVAGGALRRAGSVIRGLRRGWWGWVLRFTRSGEILQ